MEPQLSRATGIKHRHRHARGRVYYTTQAKNPGQDPTRVRIEPALYQKVNTIVNPILLWSLQSKRNIKRKVFIHRGKLKRFCPALPPPPHSGLLAVRSRVSNLHQLSGCWGFIIIVVNKSNNYQELPFLLLPQEGGGATPGPLPLCHPSVGDGCVHGGARTCTHFLSPVHTRSTAGTGNVVSDPSFVCSLFKKNIVL